MRIETLHQHGLLPLSPDQRQTSPLGPDYDEDILHPQTEEWIFRKPIMVRLGQRGKKENWNLDSTTALLIPTDEIDQQNKRWMLAVLFAPNNYPQIRYLTVGDQSTPTHIGRHSTEFGAEGSGLVIQDDYVSRDHAVIFTDPDGNFHLQSVSPNNLTAVLTSHTRAANPGEETPARPAYPTPLAVYYTPMEYPTIIDAGQNLLQLNPHPQTDGRYAVTIRHGNETAIASFERNTLNYINSAGRRGRETVVGPNFITLSGIGKGEPYTSAGVVIAEYGGKPHLFVIKFGSEDSMSVHVSIVRG